MEYWQEERIKRLRNNDVIDEVCFLLSSLTVFSDEEKQQIKGFKDFLRSKQDVKELVK